jgi:hypothetical protein
VGRSRGRRSAGSPPFSANRFGRVHEFLVEALEGPAEYVECFTGGQVSPLHQDAFGLTDDVAGAQRAVWGGFPAVEAVVG